MADNEGDTPDFSEEQYEQLDEEAKNIIDSGEADVEVDEGEDEGDPHATDDNGNGWRVTRVVVEIKKVKPST